MRGRSEADRCTKRLAREHVRAVELARDHSIEQHFPVRLRLERHVETLVLEVAELVRDRERRHVRELDEAELELVFFQRPRGGTSRSRRDRCERGARAEHNRERRRS